MLLNLKQLGGGFSCDEKTLDFTYKLDLSAVRLWGEFPFKDPVSVTGLITLRTGIYTIEYTVRFSMHGACSRCLSPVIKEVETEFTHTALTDAEGEDLADGFILAPDGELDLDELVISDLILKFNGVMLCDENCLGLCPKCGKNLNEGECGCSHKEPDLRFDALRKLMEEQN